MLGLFRCVCSLGIECIRAHEVGKMKVDVKLWQGDHQSPVVQLALEKPARQSHSPVKTPFKVHCSLRLDTEAMSRKILPIERQSLMHRNSPLQTSLLLGDESRLDSAQLQRIKTPISSCSNQHVGYMRWNVKGTSHCAVATRQSFGSS